MSKALLGIAVELFSQPNCNLRLPGGAPRQKYIRGSVMA